MAQLHLAVSVLVADLQAAGLRIAQIGAGANLEILLLAGGPGLDVAGLALQVCQIAGAALQLPHGDVQGPEQLYTVLPHLLVPLLGVLRLADHDHFLLFELMDAVDAALLDAMGTLLLAEAGGVGGQRLGQLVLRQDLVNELADHGVLAGADEIQVLALDLIHHGVHVRLAHDALHHVAVDHKRRDAVGKALADHEVAGVSQHCFVQPRDIAQQVVEAVAGHAACSVHIDAVEALHDLGVVRNGEIGHHRLTKALCFHVVGIIRADGHAGIDHLRDGVHDLLNACGQGLFFLFQLSHLVGIDLSLQLGLLCLIGALLQLAEQGAVGLAQLVAGSLEGFHFLQACAVLGILLDDLVHQRELCILKLLLDVFLDSVRVFTDKFDIKHD